MDTLGRHLIAEYYGCDGELLDDVDAVGAHLVRAAEQIGATVVSKAFHRYAPQGVSGVILIAESHLSIHTWPESGYAAIDIYTCGGLDPRPGFELLGRLLKAEQGRMQEIVRGLPQGTRLDRPLLPDDVKILEGPLTNLEL